MSLRIAFLSFAHMHAYGYARHMLTLPRGTVDIAGVWDKDATRGKKMARALGTRFFSARDKLLAAKLHGAVVCSENTAHLEDARAAAQAGVGVLCEKPLTTTSRDARELVDLFARARLPLMTAFPCRFAGAMQRLKEQFDDGVIGTLCAAYTSNHGRQPGRWFTDSQHSGGGAVMDHTVHVVDLLRWLTKREVARVYAVVGYNRFHLTRQAVGKKRIDDAAVLTLEFDGGVVASLDCSWSRPAEYSTWGDLKLELLGTQGVARLDLFRQRVLLAARKTGKTVERCWGDEKDGGVCGEFVRCLRDGSTPSVTGEDGLRATEVVEAAYRSAECGEPVAVQHL